MSAFNFIFTLIVCSLSWSELCNFLFNFNVCTVKARISLPVVRVKLCMWQRILNLIVLKDILRQNKMCSANISMGNGNTPPHSLFPHFFQLFRNLHSKTSLFPIIPWQFPLPTRLSEPTYSPCQSNQSKGQRPKSCGCVFTSYIFYIRLWWLQNPCLFKSI